MRSRLGFPLLTILVVGCTLNPNGDFRQSYQVTNAGDTTNSTLSELFEIGIQNKIGTDLEYRLGERLIRTDSTSEADDDTLRDTRWLNHPSVDIVATVGAIAWTQGFDIQQNTTSPSVGEDNTLVRKEVLEKVEWSPVGLPTFTTWIDVRDTEDDLFINREDREAVLQIQETRGAFEYFYSLESETIRDVRCRCRA